MGGDFINISKNQRLYAFLLDIVNIERGKIAKRILDWSSTKTVAFDFKINREGRRRGKQAIAVLSDLPKQRCCSVRKAIFSVFKGLDKELFSLAKPSTKYDLPR